MSQKARLYSQAATPRRPTHPATRDLPPFQDLVVSSVHGFDMFPAIRGVQDHTSNWMSGLIQAQDGCLQMVAHRLLMGRVQQEQLAHNLAQRYD